MKLEELDVEHLRYLHTMYQRYCGDVTKTFEASMLKFPGEVLRDLVTYKSGNYRIGSRYSKDSGLIIREDEGRIRVEFDPRSEEPMALESKDSFEDAVRMYLVHASKASKR